MDVWWNNHFHIKIWNYPTETTVKKLLFRVPGREFKNLTNERIDSKAKNLLLEKSFWRFFEIPRRHSSTSMSTLMASSLCWSGVPKIDTKQLNKVYKTLLQVECSWKTHDSVPKQHLYTLIHTFKKSWLNTTPPPQTKSMDSFLEFLWNLPRFLLPIPSPTLSFESGNPCSTIDTSPNGSTYRKLIEPELMGVDQHIHGTAVLGCPRKLVNG